MSDKTPEEIINEVLTRDFEIPEEKLRPDAALFSDLELDSLDIVDLIVALEKAFGMKIRTDAAQAFRDVRTLGDLHAAVRKMRDDAASDSSAPPQEKEEGKNHAEAKTRSEIR